MSSASKLPSIETLKAQARALRQQLARGGETISHSHALEALARQHGFRNWNTLCATAPETRRNSGFNLGDEVGGTYLGQPFTGEVIGAQRLANGLTRLTIAFDEPVDVVSFEGFSNFRKRVNCIVDADGVSPAKLSGGAPQMRLR